MYIKGFIILLSCFTSLSFGFYFDLDNNNVKCFKEHYGNDQLISGDVIIEHPIKLKFWVSILLKR